MSETLRPDLCILGDCAAGWHAAFLAAGFGVPVIVVTGHEASEPAAGDRTLALYALRAAAMTAARIRRASAFGLEASLSAPDIAAVLQRVRAQEERVAPRFGWARYRALGIRILAHKAQFENATSLRAGPHLIIARRFIVAGAPAANPAPPGPGMLTPLTLLDADTVPSSVALLGDNAIAIGLAQALARLGLATSLIAKGALLPGEDPEQTAIIADALARDGVALYRGAGDAIIHAAPDGMLSVSTRAGSDTAPLAAGALINCESGAPALDALGLAKAGIGSTEAGIRVDQRLRTDNRAIFAIGDAAALPGPCSLHAAQAQAECVIKQILFRLPATYDPLSIPRVMATDPEWASVGLTEAEARERHGALSILRSPFSSNDRALVDGHAAGHAKIIRDRRGRLLGVSLTGEQASSLIVPWAAALGRKPDGLRRAAAPYPSLAETPRRALMDSYAPLARSQLIRMLSAFLRRWG